MWTRDKSFEFHKMPEIVDKLLDYQQLKNAEPCSSLIVYVTVIIWFGTKKYSCVASRLGTAH
jgi:hypothetical protein